MSVSRLTFLDHFTVRLSSDVTKTGNGEWGMGNGKWEWEIENRKWEIQNGKLILFTLTFYIVE